jgi:hypothetical protein
LTALRHTRVGCLHAHRLIPHLGNSCDKRVLYSILLRLFTETFQNGTALAQAVGNALLDAYLLGLRLWVLDFPHGDEHLRLPSLANGHADNYPSLFLQLVMLCFEQGRKETSLSLLTTSCSNILENWGSWPETLSSIDGFLLCVPTILEKYNNREATTVVKDLWVAFFSKYFVGVIPPRPVLRGQAHKRRGFGPPTCTDCTKLDKSLQSETENTFTLVAETSRRNNVESRLSSSLFKTEIDKERSVSRSYALIVKKLGLEHKVDLFEYGQQVLAMKSRNDPFKNDTIKTFMGDELYDKFVLLSHVSASDIEPPPIARQKRGASSSWETSSIRNPYPYPYPPSAYR